MTEFIKISSDMVQCNIDNSQEVNESFASLLLNPYVTWAKFILTDDEPNGNNVRIPKEEFSNLINSGIYMPIKMTLGEIEGHEASIPIGVITHLKEVKNRVEGLAALWRNERPEDIELLKEKHENEETLNISWEIGYSVWSDSPDYEGVVDLFDTKLKAATLVETPAYAGRTTILALAEQEKNNMDELEKQINELEKSLAEMKEEKEELLEKLDGSTAKVDELTSELAEVTSKVTDLNSELEELRVFKTEAEEKLEKEEKVSDIKTMFTEAGIEKDDKYFEENLDTLLSMDEGSLEFLIQEVVAFGEKVKKAAKEDVEQSEHEDSELSPKILGGDDEVSNEALVEFLKSGETEEDKE